MTASVYERGVVLCIHMLLNFGERIVILLKQDIKKLLSLGKRIVVLLSRTVSVRLPPSEARFPLHFSFPSVNELP